MVVSVNHIDVCTRDYSDFCVIYDLRNKQIIKLENVAADIWKTICERESVSDREISKVIAEEYECDEKAVLDDVIDFIDELYCSGIVLVDGKYCEGESVDQEIDTNDDYEGAIISELEGRNQIYSATFEMTYACNEKCVHCYADYPDNEVHISVDIDTYKKAVDDLLEMNCMHISFTGGDPFMNRDFPELFEYSRKKGFVCDIFTNAVFLYDHEDILERIAALRPRAFYISLYGSTPEIHDRITQIPGSFRKTIAVVEKLRALDISVVFNMMVLTLNHLDIDNMIQLAKLLGAEYRVSMSVIYKNDGDDEPMNYFVGDKGAIKQVLSKSKKKIYSMDKASTNAGEYMCGAGVTSLSISPDGTVYPCISLKNPLGNITKESVSDCWNNKQRVLLCNSLKWSETEECEECMYKEDCQHCPGISQAETGNMFACNTCDKMIAECNFERRHEL